VSEWKQSVLRFTTSSPVLTRLYIDDYYSWSRLKSTLTKFLKISGSLRTLQIKSISSFEVSDNELIECLGSCPELTTVDLASGARFRYGWDSPTLLSISGTLSKCPKLTSISGVFNLDTRGIKKHPPLIPHPAIRTIGLTSSFFLNDAPDGWVQEIVGFLSALSRGMMDISLDVQPCVVENAPKMEAKRVLKEREKAIPAFKMCVKATNAMKSHYRHFGSRV
jgi:hypothetical protein